MLVVFDLLLSADLEQLKLVLLHLAMLHLLRAHTTFVLLRHCATLVLLRRALLAVVALGVIRESRDDFQNEFAVVLVDRRRLFVDLAQRDFVLKETSDRGEEGRTSTYLLAAR